MFGLPLLKVNEYYVNDQERMVFPWGVQEGNPRLDQGGNIKDRTVRRVLTLRLGHRDVLPDIEQMTRHAQMS